MVPGELFIIRNIQFVFYSDKSKIVDNIGKVISGRKYRLFYLLIIFVLYGLQLLVNYSLKNFHHY